MNRLCRLKILLMNAENKVYLYLSVSWRITSMEPLCCFIVVAYPCILNVVLFQSVKPDRFIYFANLRIISFTQGHRVLKFLRDINVKNRANACSYSINKINYYLMLIRTLLSYSVVLYESLFNYFTEFHLLISLFCVYLNVFVRVCF